MNKPSSILTEIQILGLHRSCIGIDFDNLRGHCSFILESLKGEEERFEEFASKATVGLDEQQKEAFYEWHQDQTWQIYDVFPSLQWMSTFLLAYGMFEKSLNDLCEAIGHSSSSEIALRDFAGQGTERAKIYLRKVCKIETPFASTEWEQITKHAKVRNVIAHTSGNLDLSKNTHAEVLNIAKANPSIKISRHDETFKSATIELTAEFTINSIESFRKFLYAVCDAYKG